MAKHILKNTIGELVVKFVSDYSANLSATNITFADGAVNDGVQNNVPTSYSIRGIEFNQNDGTGTIDVYRSNTTANTLIYTLAGQGLFDLANFGDTDAYLANKEIKVTSNTSPSHAYTAIFYLRKGYE